MIDRSIDRWLNEPVGYFMDHVAGLRIDCLAVLRYWYYSSSTTFMDWNAHVTSYGAWKDCPRAFLYISLYACVCVWKGKTCRHVGKFKDNPRGKHAVHQMILLEKFSPGSNAKKMLSSIPLRQFYPSNAYVWLCNQRSYWARRRVFVWQEEGGL